MEEPTYGVRPARLQEVRASMEQLHAEALAERHGEVFSVEETLDQIASPRTLPGRTRK